LASLFLLIIFYLNALLKSYQLPNNKNSGKNLPEMAILGLKSWKKTHCVDKFLKEHLDKKSLIHDQTNI